jgi:NTE family protein
MNGKTIKVINLALQGGGSHGAFTWGVLERFLEDERIEFEGISGTSSGAINAATLAYGLATGGRTGAIEALRKLWERVANEFSEVLSGPFYMSMLNLFNDAEHPALDAYLSLTKTFSPYHLNPMDMNPLRDLVAETIDFKYLQKDCPVKLFIAATHVRTGKLKIFENRELTIDALMASACLPSIHRAVEIDGESYWDGGFAGNPPVFPLIFNCKHKDIVIVLIHPLEVAEMPVTADEIQQRTSELSFNTAFLREMRAIAFSKKMIDKDWMPSGKLENRMDEINIHIIQDQALSSQYNNRSRYNTLPSFINLFHKEGYAAADVWLEENFDRLGKKSSVDLAAMFC